MASRRKQFTPKGKAETDTHLLAEFIAGVLDGSVKATRLHEVETRGQRKRLEYDDPEG